MKMTLRRKEFTDKSTIGLLLTDSNFFCHSLEDVCRQKEPGQWSPDLKVPGKTAIPYGTYPVVITVSHRFGKRLPLLLNVPSFSGVRIHSGNTSEDTEGCILVGQTKGPDAVYDSRTAMAALMDRIENALKAGPVTIEVTK